MQVFRRASTALSVLAWMMLCASPTLHARQGAVESLGDLLGRVGDRVQAYFDRISSVICTEAENTQELGGNLKPRGKPKEHQYDLMFVRQSNDELIIERELKAINGRAIKPSQRRQCMERSKGSYSDALNLLLPQNRPLYQFIAAGREEMAGRQAVVVNFTELKAREAQVTWDDNCFKADGGRTVGKLWLDPETFDVLRIETRLAEPFKFFTPSRVMLERRLIVVRESTMTVKFRSVTFSDPEETLLLPESIESVNVIDGATAPRVRITQSFRDHRRFKTDAKIIG